MHRRAASLRRWLAVTLLALFAMAMQVTASAEHLGASAARALSGAEGARLGFLQICTGEGIVEIPGPAGPDDHHASVTCVVCSFAAGSQTGDGWAVAPALPASSPPDTVLAALSAPAAPRAGAATGVPAIRAPPVLS